MKKEINVLFDMDGVMIDTETQYDKLWEYFGQRYDIGVPNLEKEIKGMTLKGIVKKFFSHLPQKDQDEVVRTTEDFESKMTFDTIPGVLEFISELKANNIKIGLVTSSNKKKLDAVNKVRHFDKLFDTLVFSERVLEGKPDPQCYRLGAQDLGVDPKTCIVFEDAIAGIEAAHGAGMFAIGVSTTLPSEILREKTNLVISDFRNFTFDDLLSIV